MKAHIKREFVDLTSVTKYFESLKVANKSNDFKLSSVAFSTICHLIKRVGMQDPHILRGVSKITLPILVNRLLDQKPNFRTQAKNSLETFWLATPTIVETYLKDSALIHSNQNIRSESIIFISDLIDLNKNFNFTQFLPNLVNLLRDDCIEVVKNTEVLLIKYYILNKGKSSELVKEFKNQRVDQRTAVKVLKEVDLVAANSYTSEVKSMGTTSRSTIDSFNNLTRSRNARTTSNISKPKAKTLSTSTELSDILANVPTAKLDESIQPKAVSSAQELSKEVELLLPPFNGKETEFNWGNREKNIIKFRSLIAGNSETYPDAMVNATRSLNEGISKSVTSLRTTLSSNGCQLIKEIAAHLTKHIDPIAEQLFHSLASMTSATKKITSMNAFGSLCVLLTNISYNNRLFNQCFTLYQDKNIQPRLYSSTFLQIFILKHGAKFDQHNLDTIQKWVSKGVSDPNISIRESMRSTFWILYKRFPQMGDAIISKQDTSVKKALERSKPSDITASFSTTLSRSSTLANERKRPSIRDFVASKQRERRSTSDSSALNYNHSREPSDSAQPQDFGNSSNAEIGKPTRIGAAQRVRVPSSGNSYMLPRQLSKGARSSSLNSHQLKTDNKSPEPIDTTGPSVVTRAASEEPIIKSPNEIEVMMKQLGSPLTRERISGIQSLKDRLNRGEKVSGLSQILKNLIILDGFLLKPLLKIPEFYDLLDVTMLLKLIAVNKEDIGILVTRFDKIEIIEGINSVISSLESLQFDNAPSTMFHIKHKNTFLDFSIKNLYELFSSDGFVASDKIIEETCQAIFPLSISDYPRYDELVVKLNGLNEELFEKTLKSSSAYIKSKIHMILEDFKEIVGEKPMDATEHGLGEMTMINPLNRKPTDPTTSIKAGFGTDMTMILPNFKPALEKENYDEDLEMRDSHEKDVDFMSDIFAKPTKRESITGQNPGQKVEPEFPGEKVQPQQEAGKFTENIEDDVDMEIRSETNIASPFLENPTDDDVIEVENKIIIDAPSLRPIDDNDDHVHSDEITRNITDQISGIHISPQKPSTPAKDMSQIINQTDPFFNNTKKHIKIFEDKEPTEPTERKLTDLELSHIESIISREDAQNSDELIKDILSLVDCFEKDQVSSKEMNKMIKCLHKVIGKKEVLSWMKTSGYKPILMSIIKYFNLSANITKELCFKGLIVFKELVVLNTLFENLLSLTETIAIWNILVMVIENLKNFKNEIYIAADEIVDEILELNLVNCKSTIRNSCYALLKEGETNNTPLTSFLMLTLIKCIEHESLSFDQIKEIDNIVYKYLTSDEVEVRRLTIITYSKCKNKLQLIDSNSIQKNINGKLKVETMDENREQDTLSFFDKLSTSQKKLVDYYSNA